MRCINFTSKSAIPDVGASCKSVQLKQLRIVTSDLFLPWKFSLIDSRKQSDGGWSCMREQATIFISSIHGLG